MTSLVKAELERVDPKENRDFSQAELIARTLVKLAVNGNITAIREVLDRTDGKVPTNVGIATNGPTLAELLEESYGEEG